ncbi:hypothetical protein XSR1_20129 [Xenorhabdus szentirmaii DSM 16338]|uniref:Uncharacterized protein n=1 Tax=Xenorhabdus szentirmaii DSM 16338 TaxID=1427518 RepID=W1IYK3_9GAMM|nr:hypothetical protein XSR1_20129 [Xenorhabdus szentirmaii DSM 16338]
MCTNRNSNYLDDTKELSLRVQSVNQNVVAPNWPNTALVRFFLAK